MSLGSFSLLYRVVAVLEVVMHLRPPRKGRGRITAYHPAKNQTLQSLVPYNQVETTLCSIRWDGSAAC